MPTSWSLLHFPIVLTSFANFPCSTSSLCTPPFLRLPYPRFSGSSHLAYLPSGHTVLFMELSFPCSSFFTKLLVQAVPHYGPVTLSISDIRAFILFFRISGAPSGKGRAALLCLLKYMMLIQFTKRKQSCKCFLQVGVWWECGGSVVGV